MKVVALTGLALLTLAGCGQTAGEPDERAQGPKIEAKTATPSAAPTAQHSIAPAVDLTPYVDKYPFDVVEGHRFLDNPVVKAAIAAAVPDAKVRSVVRYKNGELGIPIKRVKGGRLLIWGGANRAEDRFNWSVVIDPDGSKPEVCIYDGLGYDEDFPSSQWFEPGTPSIMKQGKCPSDGEDYPAAPIAAG
jgi:hypothetical protein